MAESVNCSLCSADDGQVLFRPSQSPGPVVRCRRCGLVYVNPRENTKMIISEGPEIGNYPPRMLTSSDPGDLVGCWEKSLIKEEEAEVSATRLSYDGHDKQVYTPLIATALALSYFVLSMAFATRAYYRDSISWAYILENSLDLFAPHHLIVLPMFRVFYAAWQWLGYAGGALLPMQVLVALFGSLGVGVFFLLAYQVASQRWIALISTALLAFSYAYWQFSTQPMSQVPALALTICGFLCLVRAQQHSKRLLLAAGVFDALAILLNQVALFPVVAHIVAAFVFPRTHREKLMGLAAFVLPLGVVVGVSYVGVGILFKGARTVHDFIFDFLLYNLFDPGLGSTTLRWGRLYPSSLWRAVAGLGNTFIGEVFAMGIVLSQSDYFPRIMSFVPTGAPRTYVPWAWNWETVLLFAALFLTLGGFLALALRGVASRKRVWRDGGPVVGVCIVWILLVAAFATWYAPDVASYWMFALPPFWLLAALVLQAAGQTTGQTRGMRIQVISALTVGALFAVNFFGSIVPSHREENNPLLHLVRLADPLLQPGDVVLTLGAGELKHLDFYFLYFSKAKSGIGLRHVWTAGIKAREALEDQIVRTITDGHRVYITSDVFNSGLGLYQVAMYTSSTSEQVTREIRDLFTPFELVPVVKQPGIPVLYQLYPRYQ